jgi:hypothetical protein
VRVSLDGRSREIRLVASPSASRALPARPPASWPVPDAPSAPAARYLVIVAPDEPGLREHLARQFAGDPLVCVLTDRRRPPAGARPLGLERRDAQRGGRPEFGHFCWIATASSVESPPPAAGAWSPDGACARSSPENERRGSMEGMEDRQRVDRWIEESQYLIGRLIPSLLDDRERLRGKLEAAEQECLRLRQEIGELRKEISDLQSETQFFRSEHAAMADILREILEHLGQVQKPLVEVHRRLQITQPALSAATA